MIELPDCETAIKMMDRWKKSKMAGVKSPTYKEDRSRNMEWNCPAAFMSIPDEFDSSYYARDVGRQ